MKFFGKSLLFYLTLTAVVLAMLTPEVEGRRKILRGRKTVNRTYLRSMAIPAWAIIVLVGLGQLVIGAVMYVVLKKTIIDPPIQGSYTVAPTHEA